MSDLEQRLEDARYEEYLFLNHLAECPYCGALINEYDDMCSKCRENFNDD